MFRRVISSPWPRVSAIAIAIMASTASGTPNPHSVSIIDNNTPSSAIIEPTESSMPPVIITRPRPMLKIPNAPICRARFWRLMASRKFGLMTETTMQRTISRTKIPSSFFISLSFSSGSEAHDGLFAELGAIENSGQTSFVHHRDAVADPEHLFHLTTDDNHRYTLRGEIANEFIDLSLGANIDSACRLVKNQHPRRERQPLREHYFLLIATTEICRTHLRCRRFDIDCFTRFAGGACFFLKVDNFGG